MFLVSIIVECKTPGLFTFIVYTISKIFGLDVRLPVIAHRQNVSTRDMGSLSEVTPHQKYFTFNFLSPLFFGFQSTPGSTLLFLEGATKNISPGAIEPRSPGRISYEILALLLWRHIY